MSESRRTLPNLGALEGQELPADGKLKLISAARLLRSRFSRPPPNAGGLTIAPPFAISRR